MLKFLPLPLGRTFEFRQANFNTEKIFLQANEYCWENLTYCEYEKDFVFIDFFNYGKLRYVLYGLQL